MAPKKDEGIFASFKDEDQYYEDFEQKLYDGFHAQKTDLDKLSYIMELSAMASDLAIIRARLMKVPSEVDRDDYKNEEEYQQALEREKERNKIEFFSEEEKKDLGFSDSKQAGKLEKIVNDAMGECYRQYKENRKDSNLELGVVGILKGQSAISAGKHFKELQESDLLKGDSNRDLKLKYIAGNTEGVVHHAVNGSVSQMEGNVMAKGDIGAEYGPDIEKTPLGNVEALKKMTVGQLLGHFHLSNEVYQGTLKELSEAARAPEPEKRRDRGRPVHRPPEAEGYAAVALPRFLCRKAGKRREIRRGHEKAAGQHDVVQEPVPGVSEVRLRRGGGGEAQARQRGL